jgi:hypothetical protein
VEPLRPAWASWIPGIAPWPKMNCTIGLKAWTCISFQMPLSSGLILRQESLRLPLQDVFSTLDESSHILLNDSQEFHLPF